MHEVVADDHHANGDVSDHARDEYEHVYDGDRHDDIEGQMFGSSGPEQIVFQRLVHRVVELDQIRSARRVVHVRCIVNPAPALITSICRTCRQNNVVQFYILGQFL